MRMKKNIGKKVGKMMVWKIMRRVESWDSRIS